MVWKQLLDRTAERPGVQVHRWVYSTYGALATAVAWIAEDAAQAKLALKEVLESYLVAPPAEVLADIDAMGRTRRMAADARGLMEALRGDDRDRVVQEVDCFNSGWEGDLVDMAELADQELDSGRQASLGAWRAWVREHIAGGAKAIHAWTRKAVPWYPTSVLSAGGAVISDPNVVLQVESAKLAEA